MYIHTHTLRPNSFFLTWLLFSVIHFPLSSGDWVVPSCICDNLLERVWSTPFFYHIKCFVCHHPTKLGIEAPQIIQLSLQNVGLLCCYCFKLFTHVLHLVVILIHFCSCSHCFNLYDNCFRYIHCLNFISLLPVCIV